MPQLSFTEFKLYITLGEVNLHTDQTLTLIIDCLLFLSIISQVTWPFQAV